jgi:hypothetical protein
VLSVGECDGAGFVDDVLFGYDVWSCGVFVGLSVLSRSVVCIVICCGSSVFCTLVDVGDCICVLVSESVFDVFGLCGCWVCVFLVDCGA